jgi:hypothetical protein
MSLLESYMRLPLATNKGPNNRNREYKLPFAMLAMLGAVGEVRQPAAFAATAIIAGPESAEQQRLFGLLCSTLKRGALLGYTQQTDAEECRLVAATFAARVQLSAAGTSSSSTTMADLLAMVELLQWLVLFGRCCLQWAVQLQWRHKGIPGLPDAAAVQQAKVSEGSTMGRLHVSNSSDVFFPPRSFWSRPPALVSLFLTALQPALQHAGIAAQLSAAGLDAGELLTKVSSAKAAVDAGRADQPDAVRAAVKGLGQVLTSPPCGTACNNPACTNMSEPSEAQLLQGNQHKCSACRTARYCGKECQAKHWKQHKPVCKALVAAAAAASAAGQQK